MLSKEGLSREKILEIAQRNGFFYVSAHYRNDTTRARCKKMCKEGLLRYDGNWKLYGAFGNYYFLAEQKENTDGNERNSDLIRRMEANSQPSGLSATKDASRSGSDGQNPANGNRDCTRDR